MLFFISVFGSNVVLVHCMDLRSYHVTSCAHAHDFAQLVLPISGSLDINVGRYSGVVHNDRGIYIAPNAQHCFSGSQTNLFLVIDIAVENPLHLRTMTSPVLQITDGVRNLIQFTQHYLVCNERDWFADSLIHQLLFHFVTSSLIAEPDHVVLKARQWIDCCFQDVVDLDRVAKHCYLSVSQLQRRFKKVMGCGLAEYWWMNKMHYAKSLLSQRDSSVEAIALAIGYDSLPAFSRRFSQLFGESPSQWRKRVLTAKKLRAMDK